MKRFHATCWEAVVIIWVRLLEDPLPTIWEGKKLPKIQRDF